MGSPNKNTGLLTGVAVAFITLAFALLGIWSWNKYSSTSSYPPSDQAGSSGRKIPEEEDSLLVTSEAVTAAKKEAKAKQRSKGPMVHSHPIKKHSPINVSPKGYLFRFTIQFRPEVQPFREARILFNFKDNRNSYYVRLGKSEIALRKIEDGESVKLSAAAIDWRREMSMRNPIEMAIQRKGNRIKLAINGAVIISAADESFHDKRAAGADKNSSFIVKAKRPQALDKIIFTDDFMRAKDSGQWDTISGVWEINSVKGTEKSPNAFSLFSRFAESPQHNELFSGRTRDYVGIGIRTSYSSGKARIRAVFFDTPAWEAGLRAGDEILEIDGIPTANMKREEIVKRISGKEGAKVKLKVSRRVSDLDAWRLSRAARTKGDRASINAGGLVVKELDIERKRIELDSINRTFAIPPDQLSRSSVDRLAQKQKLDEKEGMREKYQKEAMILAGYDFWSDYIFKVAAKSLGWGSMGMIFYFQDEEDYYLFEWCGWEKSIAPPLTMTNEPNTNDQEDKPEGSSRNSLDASPNQSEFRLVRVKDGERKVLAEKKGGFVPNEYYEMVVAVAGETVTALVDDAVIFSVQQNDLAWGKIGLYAALSKGVYFDDVYLTSATTTDFTSPETLHKEDASNFHASRIFREDRFMKRWANKAEQWEADSEQKATERSQTRDRGRSGRSRTYWPFKLFGRSSRTPKTNRRAKVSTKRELWHKYLFFGDVKVEVDRPAFGKRLDIAIGAEVHDWFSGYRLTLDKGTKTVAIYREGALEREGKFDPNTLRRVRFERKGTVVRAELTSRRKSFSSLRLRAPSSPSSSGVVLSFNDSRPLRGSRFGVRGLNPSYDTGSINVSSPSVLEYIFDRAPVDWHVASGRWGVMNRWVCDQRWSFFGGRSDAIASIWNKHAFEGDVSVDFYAAHMMPAYWKSPYERPGDICVTICGDGENVSSGYSLILGGGHNCWTRLYKGDKIIGETFSPRFLLPRREISDGVELRLHERWFHLNLRKIGARIQFLFNERLCFDFDDPEPLNGKRIAIWTTNNGIIVSRVRIAAEKRTARTLVTESSLPFNDGEWTNVIDADNDENSIDIKSAEIHSEVSRKAREYEISNRIGGGVFAVKAAGGAANVSENPVVEFEYKMTHDVKVDLYFTYAGLQHRITFTGPPRTGYDVMTLGKFANVIADGKWHRTSFNILDALKDKYPPSGGPADHRPAFVIENVIFANYSNYRYLLCGFGGNWKGAAYSIRKFKIACPKNDKTPPRVLSVSFPFDAVNNCSKVIFHLDDEGGSGIDAEKLKLRVNGRAYTLLERPEDAHLTKQQANHTSSQKLAASPVEYDYVRKELTFDIPRAGVTLKDGDKITVELFGLADRAGNVSRKKVKRSWTFDYRKDNSPPQDVEITSGRDYLIDYDFEKKGPPLMAGDSLQSDLEEGKGQGLYPVKPRSRALRAGAGGWLTRYPRFTQSPDVEHESAHAACSPEGYSLKVINRKISHDFGVGFCKAAYNAGRYPILSFDYNIPPWTAIDISLQAEGIRNRSNTSAESDRKAILFASKDFRYDLRAPSSYDTLGEVEGVKHDGSWHHTDVSIYKLLEDYDPTVARYNVKNIHFGDDVTGRLGNYEGRCFYLDNIKIEPIIRARDLKFAWTASDISGIVDYRSALNDITDYRPLGKVSEEDYRKPRNGFAYFHLMLRDGAGNWTAPIHYRVFLDSKPPVARSIDRRPGWDDTITVRFDEENGVDPQSVRLKVGDKVLTVDNKKLWINQRQSLPGYLGLSRLTRGLHRRRAGLKHNSDKRGSPVLTCRLSPKTCGQEVFDEIFGEKESVTVTLLSAADFAGNEITRQLSTEFKKPRAAAQNDGRKVEDLDSTRSLIDDLLDILQR